MRGKLGGWDLSAHTPLSAQQITNKDLLYSSGNSVQHSERSTRRKHFKNADICMKSGSASHSGVSDTLQEYWIELPVPSPGDLLDPD